MSHDFRIERSVSLDASFPNEERADIRGSHLLRDCRRAWTVREHSPAYRGLPRQRLTRLALPVRSVLHAVLRYYALGRMRDILLDGARIQRHRRRGRWRDRRCRRPRKQARHARLAHYAERTHRGR